MQRVRAQCWRRSNSRYPHGTGGCRKVRIPAGGCGMSVPRPMQAFWLWVRQRDDTRDCHGKEGVAGSSPAEGSSETPAQAGLLFARTAALGMCRAPLEAVWKQRPQLVAPSDAWLGPGRACRRVIRLARRWLRGFDLAAPVRRPHRLNGRGSATGLTGAYTSVGRRDSCGRGRAAGAARAPPPALQPSPVTTAAGRSTREALTRRRFRRDT